MGSGYPPFKPLIGLLFFVYIGAHLLQVGIRSGFLGSIRFEFLVASSLLFLALVYRTPIKYPNQKISGYLIFFIICLSVQVPLSVSVEHSWNVFVDRVIKFSAMALFIAKFVDNPKMLFVFLAGFLLSCFKMGSEGLIGNITGSLVWQNQGVMRLHGSTPNYAHPNSFAGMAIGVLPFVYYLFPLVNKYLKAFFLVLLAFAVNIIVFSGSRTAYVAFFALLGYVFWNSQYKARAIFGGIIVLGVLVAYTPSQYVGRFESIFSGHEAEGNSSGKRIQILKDAVEIFAQHPLGVGVSAFPIVRKEYFGRTQDTHNLYLEVATNLGIQGFVAFTLLVFAMIKGLASVRNNLQGQLVRLQKLKVDDDSADGLELAEHRKNLEFFLATSKAITLYLVVRLVLGVFGMDLYEIYWWIVIGFVYSLSKLSFVAEINTRRFLSVDGAGGEPKNKLSKRAKGGYRQ